MRPGLRVSVVMPSYDHGRYIRDAIESVLAQSYKAVDLLVMDGGSTDGTVDILKSYGARIRFVSQRDRGQVDAINRGLARVDGDIVCWLNSDDMFLPGAIERAVSAFEENPDAEFVYGRGWNIDEAGSVIEDAGVMWFDLWKLIHQRNFIQQPSCFFRKSLLQKVGPIDESLYYVMDWDLWIRFAAYTGLYVDEFLSHNRVYRDNKTQSGEFRRWREIRAMVRRYTDARWPPVVWLYFMEALIQAVRSRRLLGRAELPLVKVFTRAMRQEMSGRYADGGVGRRFRFSAGDPLRKRRIRLTFSPLSRYDASLLGRGPAVVRWKSSAGERGELRLLENGAAQEFVIAAGPPTAHGFVHVSCRSDYPARRVTSGGGLPARRIIGFLDRIDV